MGPQPPRGTLPIGWDPEPDRDAPEEIDDAPEWERQAPRPRGRPRRDPSVCADCDQRAVRDGSKYCDWCRPSHLCTTCGMAERTDRYECSTCRDYRRVHRGATRPDKLIYAAWYRRMDSGYQPIDGNRRFLSEQAWREAQAERRANEERRPDEALLAEQAALADLAE
jgi:hypothetical protein